jgi:hypothetical protein
MNTEQDHTQINPKTLTVDTITNDTFTPQAKEALKTIDISALGIILNIAKSKQK